MWASGGSQAVVPSSGTGVWDWGWEWGVGPGATGSKQLADFTGHIIFYGHPKKNVRLWRDLSLSPLSALPFFTVDTIVRS